MAMAKVYNDSDYTWKEKFKGEDVEIKAHSFIEMEYYDAHQFKGQYVPVHLDGNNQPIDKHLKKIRVEGASPGILKTDEMNCHLCKEKFLSFTSLNDHVSLRHKDAVVTDEEAEKAIATKRRGRKPKIDETATEGA